MALSWDEAFLSRGVKEKEAANTAASKFYSLS